MGTPRGEAGLQVTRVSVGKGVAPLQMHKASKWPSCAPEGWTDPSCHPHVRGGQRGFRARHQRRPVAVPQTRRQSPAWTPPGSTWLVPAP